MKTVFMGTPDIAAEVLKSLINSDNEVLAVVTQPDKPKGRGNEICFSSVKTVALEHGIQVLQPIKASEEGFINELSSYKPDIIVVAAYGQILKKPVLEMAKYGCINVHASLLPKYRGAAPIQWSIINGDKETGITIQRMNEGIDTGDIILSERLTIAVDETAGSLHDRLSVIAGPVLLRAMKQIEDGTAVQLKQDESQASHVTQFTKSMGELNFKLPAQTLERLIRGLIPWPGAYTYLGKKTLKLWKTTVITNVQGDSKGNAPGTLIIEGKNRMLITTGDGMLEIKELQLEGKKKMSAEEFLRGYHLETGIVLGIR